MPRALNTGKTSAPPDEQLSALSGPDADLLEGDAPFSARARASDEGPDSDESDGGFGDGLIDDPRDVEARAEEAAIRSAMQAIRSGGGTPTPQVKDAATDPLDKRMEREFAAEMKARGVAAAKQALAIRRWINGGRHGPAPVTARPRLRRSDPTAIPVNRDGTPIKQPGWGYVWVPEIDLQGNPDPGMHGSLPTKVNEYVSDGYQIILDAEGQPVRGTMGLLVGTPDPEVRATRVAALMPEGAVTPEQYLIARMEEFADSQRTGQGDPALRINQEPEHGRAYRSHI